MKRLRWFLSFIRNGPFHGIYKPLKLKFDEHSYQAVGYDAADRYDVLMSARADREADIAYWSSR